MSKDKNKDKEAAQNLNLNNEDKTNANPKAESNHTDPHNEHQNENPVEMEKLLESSAQVLENFRALDAEIKFSTKEVGITFQKIIAEVEKGAEEIKSMSLTLDKNLNSLARETTVLAMLPKKISDHLNELVPQIAAHIQREGFKEYNNVLTQGTQIIDKLNEQLDFATKKIATMESQSLKEKRREKLRSFTIMILISLLLSSAITSTMLKIVPRAARIDTTGDIIINDGKISIWRTDKNNLQSSQETKTKLMNKNEK